MRIIKEIVTATIEPPIEEPTAITDCDSDKSDDEVTCNPDHLQRRKGKSTKIFTFSDFHDFFTAIYSADFCKTWFHSPPIPYKRIQKCHTYRLEPIGNNIRASWTKIGKSSKIFTFSDLHDFFTAIYSTDFCETWFHGSPIPYKRIQKVSYLLFVNNWK